MRSDFRRTSSKNILPAPPPPSKASASARSRKNACGGIATLMATTRSIRTCSTWAAIMRSASGEDHAWTPESVAKLQHAVRGNLPEEYRAFAATINEQSERLLTIRGLMQFKFADKSIALDEVEPAAEIVKRFATGAMSFGSISREAHTNLAIAMNRIGGRSNTGEGGEESDRFKPLANGDSMRS